MCIKLELIRTYAVCRRFHGCSFNLNANPGFRNRPKSAFQFQRSSNAINILAALKIHNGKKTSEKNVLLKYLWRKIETFFTSTTTLGQWVPFIHSSDCWLLHLFRFWCPCEWLLFIAFLQQPFGIWIVLRVSVTADEATTSYWCLNGSSSFEYDQKNANDLLALRSSTPTQRTYAWNSHYTLNLALSLAHKLSSHFQFCSLMMWRFFIVALLKRHDGW